MDRLISRFVTTSDDRRNDFIFDLPECWWSRPYEYAWAAEFADRDATVLDAACGIEHPLKFHLAKTCRACHACDIDPRILNQPEMRSVIEAGFGESSARQLFEPQSPAIRYSVASLTDLPWSDATFDRVFCISVLEHLKDRFNKWPFLRHARPLLPFVREDIFDSLVEFRRVLAPGGLIVLTFDCPRISLRYLCDAVRRAGLRFASEVNLERPAKAIYSAEHKLHCFRAVLCHDVAARQLAPATIPPHDTSASAST